MLSAKEYQTVSSIQGPLMMVEMIDEAKYGHIVDIELPDGSVRHGQILQVENDKVLVQVFEGTSGIDVKHSTDRPIPQLDVDDMPVLGLVDHLDHHQRALDIGYCLILFHR